MRWPVRLSLGHRAKTRPAKLREPATFGGTLAIYAAAALAEIAGCFSFWAWLRLGRSSLWALVGAVSLLLFAWLLTRVETAFAGRAYAAYGGVYVTASLAWMWAVEGRHPDRWDLGGALLTLGGTAVILFGPRR